MVSSAVVLRSLKYGIEIQFNDKLQVHLYRYIADCIFVHMTFFNTLSEAIQYEVSIWLNILK